MFGALRNKFARKKICAAPLEKFRERKSVRAAAQKPPQNWIGGDETIALLALTVSDDARRLKEQLRGKKFPRLSG
jgi:hypothetical protein